VQIRSYSRHLSVPGLLVAALLLPACASNHGLEGLIDILQDASFEHDGGADPEGGVDELDAQVASDLDAEASDSGVDAGGGSDSDASNASCGDGILGSVELCDTAIPVGSPGACPTSCAPAQGACMRVALVGSGCSARCEPTTIASCANGDGCCANGCTTSNDNDCSASCGNGIIESSEACDGNCPSTCDDQNVCTTDTATGSSASCDRRCQNAPITACKAGDGCCPPGCTNANDSDCSATCGDQVVNNGERCDGNCPTTCTDPNACTADVLSGSAAQCNVQCAHNPIAACRNGDGCCPSGCFANTDNDCQARCGNAVVEPGEECEPASSNDANCSAGCKLAATECLDAAVARGRSRTDTCVVCGCNSCSSQLKACYDATDVATAGPAAGTSRGTLCGAVVDCAKANGCSGSACYCGSASTISCATGGANGPCKTQIERAAETTSPITIQSRQTNTSFAIGRSNAVSECSVTKCKAECGL
jgi:hypothetical protein